MLVLSLKALPDYPEVIRAFDKMNIRYACEVIGTELICVFDTEIPVQTLRHIYNVCEAFSPIDITSELTVQRVSNLIKKVS